MATPTDLPQLPTSIHVDVNKGESGALLARLTEYNVFTEADTLNELFVQVNDLIYAYFEVPEKYQDKICYIPPRHIQDKLVKIAEQPPNKKYSEFAVTPYYDISLIENLKQNNASR